MCPLSYNSYIVSNHFAPLIFFIFFANVFSSKKGHFLAYMVLFIFSLILCGVLLGYA